MSGQVCGSLCGLKFLGLSLESHVVFPWQVLVTTRRAAAPAILTFLL